MDKDEMKNRISLALKDPILQQGFEIICKENAELKADNDARKFAMVMSEKVEKQLREENEELKNKLEHRNCVDCSNHGSNIKLLKAKEIIKELLSSCFGYNSKTVNYEVKTKAEQFLNSEVEK